MTNNPLLVDNEECPLPKSFIWHEAVILEGYASEGRLVREQREAESPDSSSPLLVHRNGIHIHAQDLTMECTEVHQMLLIEQEIIFARIVEFPGIQYEDDITVSSVMREADILSILIR